MNIIFTRYLSFKIINCTKIQTSGSNAETFFFFFIYFIEILRGCYNTGINEQIILYFILLIISYKGVNIVSYHILSFCIFY